MGVVLVVTAFPAAIAEAEAHPYDGDAGELTNLELLAHHGFRVRFRFEEICHLGQYLIEVCFHA
jgi:hypothetical protein